MDTRKFENSLSKYFQVYRRRAKGGYMHITRLEAASLTDALSKWNAKESNRFSPSFSKVNMRYKITGITQVPERSDLNLPSHILRRIRNNGVKVRVIGDRYEIIKSNQKKS